MTGVSDAAAQIAIGAAARELRLCTVRDQVARLAEIAARELRTYLAYLAEVLAAELDDRSVLLTSISDDQAAPLHEHGSAAVDDHSPDCSAVLADPDSAIYRRIRW